MMPQDPQLFSVFTWKWLVLNDAESSLTEYIVDVGCSGDVPSAKDILHSQSVLNLFFYEIGCDSIQNTEDILWWKESKSGGQLQIEGEYCSLSIFFFLHLQGAFTKNVASSWTLEKQTKLAASLHGPLLA